MLFEQFAKSEGAQTKLREALATLRDINAFALFMEMGTMAKLPVASDLIEANALNGAWKQGYATAVNDIYYIFDIFENFNKGTNGVQPKPDFGAADALLREEKITPKEYAELTGRAAPGNAS